MTAALEEGEWSAARPGRTLPPGKTRYPFYKRLGRPQGLSGRAENLVPTGIRSRTVQPVVSRYTDWAARPTIMDSMYRNSITPSMWSMAVNAPVFTKLVFIQKIQKCSVALREDILYRILHK